MKYGDRVYSDPSKYNELMSSEEPRISPFWSVVASLGK